MRRGRTCLGQLLRTSPHQARCPSPPAPTCPTSSRGDSLRGTATVPSRTTRSSSSHSIASHEREREREFGDSFLSFEFWVVSGWQREVALTVLLGSVFWTCDRDRPCLSWTHRRPVRPARRSEGVARGAGHAGHGGSCGSNTSQRLQFRNLVSDKTQVRAELFSWALNRCETTLAFLGGLGEALLLKIMDERDDNYYPEPTQIYVPHLHSWNREI